MGADVSGYYDRMQTNANADSDNITNLLSLYTSGASDLGNQYSNTQNDNAQYLASLLTSLIDADTNRYITDAEVSMNESNNRNNLSIAQMESDLTKYQTNLNDALTRYQTDKSAENALEIQKLSNEINRYISDNDLTATRETNSLNAQLQREANALSRELAQLEAAGITESDTTGSLSEDDDTWIYDDSGDELSADAKRVLDNLYNHAFGSNAIETTLSGKKKVFYDAVNDAIDKGLITKSDYSKYVATKDITKN